MNIGYDQNIPKSLYEQLNAFNLIKTDNEKQITELSLAW